MTANVLINRPAATDVREQEATSRRVPSNARLGCADSKSTCNTPPTRLASGDTSDLFAIVVVDRVLGTENLSNTALAALTGHDEDLPRIWILTRVDID